MVASHASCAFSFGASERLGGWGGEEAPVNIWTWAGQGLVFGETRAGSQAGEVGAPADRPWEAQGLRAPSPLPETLANTGTECGRSQHSGAGLQVGGPVATPPQDSAAEGGAGRPRTEEGREKAAGAQAGSVVLLAPSSSGAGGAELAVVHPARPHAPQKRPQSFRLFLMMTSVTASNTNCTFLVSVAHVKCV